MTDFVILVDLFIVADIRMYSSQLQGSYVTTGKDFSTKQIKQ